MHPRGDRPFLSMSEATISFTDHDLIRTLFGAGDQYLRQVRDSVSPCRTVRAPGRDGKVPAARPSHTDEDGAGGLPPPAPSSSSDRLCQSCVMTQTLTSGFTSGCSFTATENTPRDLIGSSSSIERRSISKPRFCSVFRRSAISAVVIEPNSFDSSPAFAWNVRATPSSFDARRRAWVVVKRNGFLDAQFHVVNLEVIDITAKTRASGFGGDPQPGVVVDQQLHVHVRV